MEKQELIEYLKNYELTYIVEDDFTNIYNKCIEYMNDTCDYSIEYLLEDWISYDVAEEIAKNELEKGGLIRLYYFLGDANLNNGAFKLDGYGNLQDVNSEDIKDLINSILEMLEDE